MLSEPQSLKELSPLKIRSATNSLSVISLRCSSSIQLKTAPRLATASFRPAIVELDPT
jgi:hypothetical protein